MNNKKIIGVILIIGLFVILLGAGLVFAQNSGGPLEVQYPTLGGQQGPQNTGVRLTTYIRYVYNFAIISGGLVALLSLIYGGFRFLTSAGNPAAATDARGQILAGFLGLVVILGSYIVLNELNPDLISLRVPGVSRMGQGIILYSQANCGGLTDTDAAMPEVAEIPDDLLYKKMNSSGSAILATQNGNNVLPLSFFSFQKAEELVIQLYPNTTCEGNAIASITNLEADRCFSMGANVQCIKLIWNIPGIWVFNKLTPTTPTDPGGAVPNPFRLPDGWEEGDDYMVFQGSQDALPNTFSDRIVAMAIVPSKSLEKNYGVIAHNISGPMLKEKGWAHIYLPGCGTNNDCQQNGDVTLYGPFNGEFSHISSLTIFNMPKIGGSAGSVKVCRNDGCEAQDVGGQWKKVFKIYSPLGVDSETTGNLDEITSTFGGEVIPYNPGNGVVYGKNLKRETWDNGNPIALGRNQADGVSAIEIDEGAHYLVLLYAEHFDDFKNINSNNSVDAAIINTTVSSLRIMKMDGRVGTIIAIKTGATD